MWPVQVAHPRTHLLAAAAPARPASMVTSQTATARAHVADRARARRSAARAGTRQPWTEWCLGPCVDCRTVHLILFDALTFSRIETDTHIDRLAPWRAGRVEGGGFHFGYRHAWTHAKKLDCHVFRRSCVHHRAPPPRCLTSARPSRAAGRRRCRPFVSLLTPSFALSWSMRALAWLLASTTQARWAALGMTPLQDVDSVGAAPRGGTAHLRVPDEISALL